MDLHFFVSNDIKHEKIINHNHPISQLAEIIVFYEGIDEWIHFNPLYA